MYCFVFPMKYIRAYTIHICIYSQTFAFACTGIKFNTYTESHLADDCKEITEQYWHLALNKPFTFISHNIRMTISMCKL